MSRIGKKPVPVGKAKIAIKEQHVTVEGPRGKLEIDVHPLIKVANQDGNVVVTRPNDEKQSKALHGLTRALIANMVEGVTNGYKKTLEIQGVGYKAEQKGKNLVLSVGYANANPASLPFVDADLKDDPAVYPPPEVRARLHTTRKHSQQYAREVNRAWTRVRTGQ